MEEETGGVAMFDRGEEEEEEGDQNFQVMEASQGPKSEQME